MNMLSHLAAVAIVGSLGLSSALAETPSPALKAVLDTLPSSPNVVSSTPGAGISSAAVAVGSIAGAKPVSNAAVGSAGQAANALPSSPPGAGNNKAAVSSVAVTADAAAPSMAMPSMGSQGPGTTSASVSKVAAASDTGAPSKMLASNAASNSGAAQRSLPNNAAIVPNKGDWWSRWWSGWWSK